jgi:hypothetical protein
MCAHDANLHRVRDWLGRCTRVGYGYGLSADLPGASKDPVMAARIRGIVLWTLVLPSLGLLGAAVAWLWPFVWVVPAAVVALHGLQVVRLAARQRKLGRSVRDSLLHGFFHGVAKWSLLLGLLRYRTRRKAAAPE